MLIICADTKPLDFHAEHNMVPYLETPPAEHSDFTTAVQGLLVCSINYSLIENPIIIESFIREFWNTAKRSSDKKRVVGKIQNR